MRMSILPEETFLTKDFYVASFLLTKGGKLSGVRRDNPRCVFFAFQDFEGREGLVRDFLFNEASVEPRAFVSAIKTLKGVLYSDA